MQFFSNQPERAWVHEKRVREYQGHKQYEQLLAEAAKQASNHSEKQKVQGALGGSSLGGTCSRAALELFSALP